jgi:hypothetical protein
MRRPTITILLLLAALAPAAALAQELPADPAGAAAHDVPPLPFDGRANVPALSDDAFVSLLTMLPGDEVYSLFGHTALRVFDPELELDRTYNYGTFDFDQPNFILRFVRGQTDYRLAVSSFRQTVAEYHRQRRPVIEQRLDLPAADRQALFEYLETNYLPQNRIYRYDFLYDNCSTRPLEALEWALGPRLALDGYAPPAGSFRDLVSPYVAGDPALRFGIDLGFGRPTDRRPEPREASFLPLELFRAAEHATIDGRPLVIATDTLFWVHGAGEPPHRRDSLTLLASLLLIGGIALTMLRPASRAARVLDVALLAFAGLAGLLLALLWFATEHHVTRLNPDLLWALPTHVVAAVMLARGTASERLRVYCAVAAAFAGAAAVQSLLGWVALPAAATPLALLIAIRCADRARRPVQTPALA